MTQTSTPTTGTDTTRQYQLAPQDTTVAFTTRHLFGLSGVAGSVRLLSGSVAVDATETELLAVHAELDMTSFATASTARDKVVASGRFLDTGTHPRASYRSVDVQRRAGGWLVRGELTAKGVSAPVDLLVDDLDPAAGGTVHATARVDRFAHGITIPTALAARHLEIDLTTRPARS